MKVKKISVLIVCMISVLVFISKPIIAEVGNSGGFDSGGSSDWGGGSSDWGGYNDWSGSSDSGSMGNAGFLVAIGMFGIFFLIFLASNESAFRDKANPTSKNGSVFSPDSLPNEDQVIHTIEQQGSQFDKNEFKKIVEETYFGVQKGWSNKDFKLLRRYESDKLYRIHTQQLQEYIDKQKTNVLRNQNIVGIYLADYHVDGDIEVLKVRLDATLEDYDVRDIDVTSSFTKSHRVYKRSYALYFIRKVGVTESELHTCPNCGAELELNAVGECTYCHTTILNGDYSWILNEFGAWKAKK